MWIAMDLTTVIGIAAGLAALVGGYLWEGGELKGLLELTALTVVFGGTFAAVAVSFPASRLKRIPRALRTAFRGSVENDAEIIERLVEMAGVARRGGVLALERYANEQDSRFLREGLLMIVDGTDPELTRQILELEIDAKEQACEQDARMFEAAGGFSPTMGIIGTVMGLIRVLGNLSDPSALGPSIAVAFTATLYGVASANILYLPIASKIKARSMEDSHRMELMLEGILGLQAGENPQLLRKKLSAFIPADEALEALRDKKKVSEHAAEA